MDPSESYGENHRQLSSQTCITTCQIKHTNVIPTNIDHIPSNTKNSDSSAMLSVFEDNEVVIKVIIKGRSPQWGMFHEPTELLWNGCLTGLIWTQKIQIRYIDTKHQLGDMLTKGNFTRDEWSNLLHLFNISHFRSTCCSKNFRLISCSTVAKRIQNQKEDERVVSKSRPAVMNISSCIATSSSTASSPIASESPGMPASGKPDSWMSIDPNSFQAASTSEVRLKDAYLGGLMEDQRGNPSHKEEEIPKTLTFLRRRPGTTKEDLFLKITKLGGNPLHTEPALQFTRKVKRTQKRRGTSISTYRRTQHTTWKPSSPWSGKSIENNLAILWKIWIWIWRFGEYSWIPLFEQQFISEKAMTRIWDLLSLEINGTAFRETEKLISGQTKTTGLSLINFQDLRWVSTSLLHFRAYQYATVKVYVFSDSVLCLEKWEKILFNPGSNKVNGIRTTIISANWIEVMDNLWNSSGRLSKDSLQWEFSMRFNRWWENYSVNQRTSQAGSSSCQCLTTLYWMQKEIVNCVWIVQRQLKSMQKDFLTVISLS